MHPVIHVTNEAFNREEFHSWRRVHAPSELQSQGLQAEIAVAFR
jgi:hypothetical protein